MDKNGINKFMQNVTSMYSLLFLSREKEKNVLTVRWPQERVLRETKMKSIAYRLKLIKHFKVIPLDNEINDGEFFKLSSYMDSI